MVRHHSLTIPVIVAAAWTASQAAPAAAQPPADDPANEARVPALTLSVGYGSHFPFGYSRLQVPGPLGEPLYMFHLIMKTLETSVRVPLGSLLILEGEVTRTSDQSEIRVLAPVSILESREAINAGVNFLVQLEALPRAQMFFGGGPGIQRTSGRLDVLQGCGPACPVRTDLEIHERETIIRPTVQAIYGVDVDVAPHTAAYFALRWRTLGRVSYDANDLSGVGLTGGVRVARRTRPEPSRALSPQSSVGKRVRVTKVGDGQLTGDLMSLTASEVVVRRNNRVESIPLNEVRKVEQVSHHERLGALIGSAFAGLMWIDIARTRDTCADCEDGPLAATMMTPVAIGAGAGIGAIVNAATRNRHLLYAAPGTSRSVRVAPILTLQHAGVGITAEW